MLDILLGLQQEEPHVASLLQYHKVDILPPDKRPEELLARKSYHVVLIEGDLDQIAALHAVDPRAEIILIGENEEKAIDAIKNGASAYLLRPLDPAKLGKAFQQIENLVEKRKETAELEKILTEKYTFSGIVGKNPQMLEIFSLVRRIAPYFRTLLVTGETGTGKELIARAVHATSPNAQEPFLVCNCGGFVEGLLESELFGHVRGAFTGATGDKKGLFEAAGKGTLFLDEIGELPLSLQPHLLRVLQNGEFRRVGSFETVTARCRIIAATHRNLEEEVKAKRFREDLFFRITPFIINVPPLKDRKDDLLLLGRYLLDQFRQRTGKKVFGISRAAQAALMAYAWPGNVRELENVLEQAAILTTEPYIRIQDLPPRLTEIKNDSPLPQTLAEVEKQHIQNVLALNNGNRTRAAKVLGISRRALLRRIESFGLR